MANNRFQVKRTSTAGRTPNTTNAGNLQYIAAGEFALNMTDQLMFTSDGTNLLYVGANQVNQRITNSLTLDNDKNIYFKTVNTSAAVGFRQQNDDNFVFYSTNTLYQQRAVWSIYANSITSAFSISVPTIFNANVNLGQVALIANGTSGTAGQILTTNGSSTYWAGAGAASVNVDAQYTWTNTQSFNANISFGNNIGFTSGAGIYFNLVADANWRIGRNTSGTTKFFYTGNTLDIIAANSALEGIALGFTGNSYLETGYAGTFTRNPIYVGNSTQNTTTTNTTITIQANTTVNSTHTASLVQVANSTSTANLTALDLKIGATTVVNSTQVTATLHVGNVSGSYANITGQVNTATLYATTSANIASAVQANATGVYTSGTVNAASHTVGTAFTANATVVNAVSYYSGTLLVANSTVSNATHLGGYTWSAPAALGGGTANTGAFTTLTTSSTALLGGYTQISGSASQVGIKFTGAGTQYGLGIQPASDGTTMISFFNAAGSVVGTITQTAANLVYNGSGASFTQTNTATLYATTSANIASAVQANATGVYTTGTVNAASHTVGTSTVANSLGVYTGIVNAATHSVGTAFTANATVVNAVSYYSGTLLVANTTVINATHLAGYNFAAPPVIGSSTANGISLTYANVSGQVNAATLLLSTNTATIGTGTYFIASGNVGIGVATPAYKLQVNGSFAATTKSFIIDHPTKQDMKLRYGSLEGPENGVYVRGRANTNKIELPEYWMQLVDENSITVTLTSIGKKQDLYVKSIENNVVTIAGSRILDYFYVVLAERKDVDKLVVEF